MPKKIECEPWTIEELDAIEEKMNASIRACVYVTDLLDGGDEKHALSSLREIKNQAELVIQEIEQRLKESGVQAEIDEDKACRCEERD